MSSNLFKKKVQIIFLFMSFTLSTIFTTSVADTYLGESDKKLFYKKHSIQNQKAVLIMTHGVLSHSGSYIPFIKKLNDNGYTVYRHDLRAHGKSRTKSDGWFMHTDEFETYLKDFNLFVQKVKNENPDSPLYLFGHSMGGLISYLHSVEMASQVKISGLILSAPALHIKVETWKKYTKLPTAKFLEHKIPKFPVLEFIDPSELTDDSTAKIQIKNDPLRVSQLTITLALEMLRASKRAQSYIFKDAPLPPLLLIQGEKDPRVLPKANLGFATYNKSLGRPTTILPLPKVFHEPLQSKKDDRLLVENGILDFLDGLK